MQSILCKFPAANIRYILAVQPETLTMETIATVIAESVGGPETRIRIIPKEEIFLVADELITVSVPFTFREIYIETQFYSNVSTIIALWTSAWNLNI